MHFNFEEIEVIKEEKKDKSEEVTQEILRRWRNRNIEQNQRSLFK